MSSRLFSRVIRLHRATTTSRDYDGPYICMVPRLDGETDEAFWARTQAEGCVWMSDGRVYGHPEPMTDKEWMAEYPGQTLSH